MISNREEIADHIETMFTGSPVDKAALVAVAQTSGAPQRVLKALEQLPSVGYRSLADLWPDLPDLPIEAGG